MPRVARAQFVVDGSPDAVAARVDDYCAVAPEGWVSRADGSRFEVATGPFGPRDWGRTVAFGALAEVVQGRTEVSIEVAMHGASVRSMRIWIVACVLAVVAAIGLPIDGELAVGLVCCFLCLGISFFFVFGWAVAGHDARADAFLADLSAVLQRAQPLSRLEAPSRGARDDSGETRDAMFDSSER